MWVLFSKEQSFYSYFFKASCQVQFIGLTRECRETDGLQQSPRGRLDTLSQNYPALPLSSHGHCEQRQCQLLQLSIPTFLASVGQMGPCYRVLGCSFHYRRTLLNVSCTYTPGITPTNFLVPVLLFPVLQVPNTAPESFPIPSVLALVFKRFLSIASSWGDPSPSLLTGTTKTCLKKPLPLKQHLSSFTHPHLFVKISPVPQGPIPTPPPPTMLFLSGTTTQVSAFLNDCFIIGMGQVTAVTVFIWC